MDVLSGTLNGYRNTIPPALCRSEDDKRRAVRCITIGRSLYFRIIISSFPKYNAGIVGCFKYFRSKVPQYHLGECRSSVPTPQADRGCLQNVVADTANRIQSWLIAISSGFEYHQKFSRTHFEERPRAWLLIGCETRAGSLIQVRSRTLLEEFRAATRAS